MTEATTITRQLELLRDGTTSARELAEQALTHAEHNRELGAWELLDPDGVRAAAEAADDLRARGRDAPLLGVPVAVKDVIDVAGLPTRAGSKAWSRLPARDAGAVAALRAAGAVIVGKTATVEFAYGIDGLNPFRPPTLNPRAPDRLPGGSSSGSAAALASGTVAGALGTDTSGSVRVPAGFCGVVGLRPSFGAVPIDGVVPLAPSYDVVGPMATNVADIALLFDVLTGTNGPPPKNAEPPRIGIVEALLTPPTCDPSVAAVLRDLIDRIERRGAHLAPVAIPGLERALAVHRTIQMRESAEVHSELGTDPESTSPAVRERLLAGAALDAETVAEAQRERARIAAAIDAALAGHDALLAPAALVPPPPRDADGDTLEGSRRLRDALLGATVPFTQHGGPALVLPAGTSDGLPIGAQLVGRRGADRALLALAARYVEAAQDG